MRTLRLTKGILFSTLRQSSGIGESVLMTVKASFPRMRRAVMIAAMFALTQASSPVTCARKPGRSRCQHSSASSVPVRFVRKPSISRISTFPPPTLAPSVSSVVPSEK